MTAGSWRNLLGTMLAILAAFLVVVVALGPMIGINEQFQQSLSTAGTVGAAFVAVWAILELRRDRAEQAQPRIWAGAEFRQHLVWFYLENVGQSAASNVTIHNFDPCPPLVMSGSQDSNLELTDHRFFADGVAFLPPGRRIEVPLDVGHRPLLKEFRFEAKYADANGHGQYGGQLTVNLEYCQEASVRVYGSTVEEKLDRLVKVFEKQAQDRQIRNSLRGLRSHASPSDQRSDDQ